MIRPSPEIEAIVRRWTERINRHDVADMPYMLSRSDALTYVGSSMGEIWHGQVVRDGIARHLAEVPDFQETAIEVEAWENGDTGWALYASQFFFPATGKRGTHRVSFVFVMEQGGWKLVQHHISQPDSNVEKLGFEHRALEALVAAVRDAPGVAFGREGLASVMFTDIAASSALARTLGDRAWSRLITDHFAMLREIVGAHGGQFVKSLGDGTMSSFASVHSAMSAAKAMQQRVAAQQNEPRLGLRIGLHTGDVVQSEDDFFGDVVNRAARITALAQPGEVYLSDVTRAILGVAPEFTFSEPIPAAFKGFEGEHIVHRLEWQVL